MQNNQRGCFSKHTVYMQHSTVRVFKPITSRPVSRTVVTVLYQAFCQKIEIMITF